MLLVVYGKQIVAEINRGYFHGRFCCGENSGGEDSVVILPVTWKV
jgi:hypothetical protein